MYVVIFTSDTVEADLKLLFVAFPFIISLFQLICCYHMVLMTFIYSALKSDIYMYDLEISGM